MTYDRADQVQQVKSANDIVEVVGEYLTLHRAGGTFKGVCPFHDDHRPSFDVDPTRQRYRCWACNKFGDVISFVQEFDRVGFREALEVLARRAGISLENSAPSGQDRTRAVMLEVLAWAEKCFAEALRDGPDYGAAREYLGGRKLLRATLDRFGVGFAPPEGGWLIRQARAAGISMEVLEQVGLVAQRREDKGYYERFRDRVMFPVRDPRGRTVGFGGRILPSSPFAARGPKYYNSAETPLFRKGELLYGLDQARQAAVKEGYLAVVEGYTDVLMAHQCGIPQVVATMGTALTARHVKHVLRLVPRVVLVYDADAGGATGVDRALEIFVSHNISLRVAALPEGLDPYDVLAGPGPEVFRSALTNATDVLEFKLNQVLQSDVRGDLEARRRAIDDILKVIALGPDLPRQEDHLKRELMVTRVAHRFGLKEEVVWARLRELRSDVRRKQQEEAPATRSADQAPPPPKRQAPAPAHEVCLLELLLADPQLVPAAAEVGVAHLESPGLRQLLDGLYRLLAENRTPSLDELRARIDNPALMAKAFELQERGLDYPDRAATLRDILATFRRRREKSRLQELQPQLRESTADRETALELLRRVQDQKGG